MQDDLRNDHWRVRLADGTTGEGRVVDRKQHGIWVIRSAAGRVRDVRWLDGEREHGGTLR